jgi:cold shock CspA family protein
MNGIVRRYNDRRGFGFIEGLTGHPGANPEIFFHVSSVEGCIAPPVGCEVSFIVVRGEKGPQAADVRLVRVRLPRSE